MSKIQYKLKKNSINSDSYNYMSDYLVDMGVKREVLRSFLGRPTEDDNESFTKLKNIKELVARLYEGFEQDKHFFIQVDSDADGITSSAIFYAYFKAMYPHSKMEYRIHEVKEHGVILDTVPNITDIVIVPDAGSNDHEVNRALSEMGKTVLIMDHHLCDVEPDYENVILVNNQTSPEYENKSLSGAGVVYKVIEAFSHMYGDGELHKKYMDLAALGIISDMMDTREVDNQYIIYNGLKNIENPMLRALITRQEYSLSNQGKLMNPTKIDIAFYITPLINGNIRMGTMEEKELMFNAFITYNSQETILRTWRGVDTWETLYENAARICSNVRDRQNRKKEKSMTAIIDRIEEQELHKNQIVLVKTGKEEVPQNITGLVAMEISKIYGKPTLILRPKKEGNLSYYAGSGRGKHTLGFQSFRNLIRDTGISKFAEG